MQIFAIDPSPVVSAQALDDRRLNKMVVETAQLLCNAVHLLNPIHTPYKPFALNHPACLWAVSHVDNSSWLLQHFHALVTERLRRNMPQHASANLFPFFAEHVLLTSSTPAHFYNGAKRRSLNIDFTFLPVHDAYKAYLVFRWSNSKIPPTWTQPSMRPSF